MANVLLASFAFIYGLAFGSFLNVCIYRLPRGLSVIRPRSACPKCGNRIAPYDNIPVLSWVLLRGRCRHCSTPITPRYAAVEILTGLLFVGCFFQFGTTIFFFKYAVLSFLLLGLIFTDAETQLLPDKLTIPGIAAGIAFSFFAPMSDFLTYFIAEGRPFHLPSVRLTMFWSVTNSVFGALIGAGVIYGIAFFWKLLRGYEGMGMGDVKLMAMVGAFLGATRTLIIMFTASILGSAIGGIVVLIVYYRRRKRYVRAMGADAGSKRAQRAALVAYRFLPMPFGVSLGIMALMAVFFGDWFLRWYLGLA